MNHTMSSRVIEEPGAHGRRIGAYRGAEPGPLVICIASLHGNEPAGIAALERVLDVLSSNQFRMRGDLVGLRGNLQAGRAGTRRGGASTGSGSGAPISER